MLRSLTLAFASLALAACSATSAPSPTASPVPSPTATPTTAPTPATTTAPTPAPTNTAPPSAPATASVAPTASATSDPVQPGGTSWADSAGEFGTRNGDRFLFQCPPDGRLYASIWGTDVYTSDSSVCTAAVHSSLISVASGGAVTIEIRPGQDSYVGSTRNGVTSSEYANWSSSFVFVGGSGPNSDLAALLAHVPDQMRANCSEVTTLSAGEVIAAQCLPDGVDGYLTYVQFDTVDNLRAAYFDDVDFFGNGADGDDCQIGPSQVIYSVGDTPTGRLTCNDYTSTDPEGKIAKWTHEPLRILGTIVVYGGTFQDMYAIWQAAGPQP